MSAGDPLAFGAGDVRRDREDSMDALDELWFESGPLAFNDRSSSDIVYSSLVTCFPVTRHCSYLARLL